MRRLGTVLHLLPQNRLVLRVGEPLSQPKDLEDMITKSVIVNEEMQEIGTIMDIFGPVENPYVVVQLKNIPEDPESIIGQKCYSIHENKES